MKKRLSLIFAAVTLVSLTLLSKTAFCGDSKIVSVDVEVPYIYSLDWYIDGSIVELTGPNAITTIEFLDGQRTGIVGGVLAATANENYDLVVSSTDDLFKGPGGSAKPVSDMSVDVDGTGYIELDGVNEVVLISDHTPEVAALKTISYQVIFNPIDISGLYSTTLVFTIKPHI